MKYWQKVFLSTLALFLVALNTGAFLLYDTAYRTALRSEWERGFSEHGFIRDKLEEDISAILSRGGQTGAALQDLFESYKAYYATQGIALHLQSTESKVYSNIPGPDNAPDVPPEYDGQDTRIADAYGTPYLYVSGGIGVTGYWLVTARSVAGLQKDADTLMRTLIIGSTGISAVLAAALFFLLRGLTAPIQKLSNAATALAGGDYGKRAEARGRDELAELARRFNEMAEKIQTQISQLSEEAEKKQRFIDDLAHEMRTPLTAIGGYSQYLAEAAITEDERLSALCYISWESKRLNDMSEKLLTLAKLRNGEIVYETVQLQKLLENIRTATKQAAEARGVALHFKAHNGTWKSDGTLLYMLVVNLVMNAVNACSKCGTVFITANEHFIEIRDDGCGMDAQSLERATEPFYRADKSRSREAGGAGLGLSICKRICERLGLILSIESTPGSGTTVKVLQDHDNSNTGC